MVTIDTRTPLVVSTPVSVLGASEPPTAVHWGLPGANPALSVFSTALDKLPAKARRVDIATSGIARLNPLLQLVPNILSSAALASGRYMEVIVNGPLATAADKSLLRPFVTGADGKIIEMAKLADPTALSTVVSGATVFQVVSVIVAQKHLADISKKLSEIKVGVERILAFQQDERSSGITGSLIHLQQLSQAVLNGELSPSSRQALESHEAALLKIQEHLTIEIQRESERTESLKDTNSIPFGSKGMHDVIVSHQILLGELCEQWVLCLRARAAAWQLLSAFPGEPNLKNAREIHIQESIENLSTPDGLLATTSARMKKKIDELRSIWNMQTTLDARKSDLKVWLQNDLPNLRRSISDVNKELVQGNAMMLEQCAPLRLMVRVRDGQVTDAYDMSESEKKSAKLRPIKK